jgi:hypothetical protein
VGISLDCDSLMKAMEPKLTILGVYQLEVTPALFHAQLPMYGNEDQCRDHFSSIVLLECTVEGIDDTFALDGFTQANPAYPHSSPQVPWDEALLSQKGDFIVARGINCVKGTGVVRFAFYMHYWDPSLPLLWSHGSVACPYPQPMPARLRKLVPYRSCD